MTGADIVFLEEWRSKLTLDKNAGYHYIVGKEKLQRVRDILKELQGDEPDLFPIVVTCSSCDEVVDMTHYCYEKYDELMAKIKSI